MKTLPSTDALQIPDELRDQFARLERRLWWVDTIIAICGSLAGLLVSYVMVFVSDRWWETPAWMRGLCTLTGCGLALYFAWGWLRLWAVHRRNLRALSTLVQRRYRRLGDRLLGIVELADTTTRPANVSPALCEAAIRQVAEEAIQFDFRAVVALRKPRIYALATVLLILLVLAPWLLVPEASWNALVRWVWPATSATRYTFVNLETLPNRLIVPHGEPFELVVSARFHSWWRPSWAVCRIDDQSPVRVSTLSGNMVFKLPGQTKTGTLILRIGDVTRRLTIEPMFRPVLQSLLGIIDWPEYLQHSPAEERLSRGSFTYLEGSRIAFRGLVSRQLSEASLSLETTNGLTDASKGTTLDGHTFTTAGLDLAGISSATLSWRDEWGLTSAAPWGIHLVAKPDQPPQARCPEQAAAVAMLEEEVLEIKMAAQDDFGLRELAVKWECRKRHETNVISSGVAQVREGNPHEDSLEGTFQFAPSVLHLPADTVISLRAATSDYFPARGWIESEEYRIYILSKEEHARLIQQELGKLMAALEDLTRRQEALLEAGRSLREQGTPNLSSDETEKTLAEQAAQQSALAQKLSGLSQQVSATLREALRNPSLSPELLEKWAQHGQAMEAIAKQPMKAAALSLTAAQQSAPDREQSLQEATEMEEEAWRRLLELQQQIGPSLDRMLASTLVHRLRRVASTEGRLERELRDLLPRTIGLETAALAETERSILNGLSSDQDRAHQESTQLLGEIVRFYDRTTERVYGAVAHEMKTTQAVESLGNMVELIRDNVSAIVSKRAGTWKVQFEAWADKLENEADDAPAGGREGDGSMSEAALRRLLALLRFRQFQIGLRETTQLLESRRETQQSYREDAILLSIRQLYLQEDVDRLDQASPGKFLPYASQAMGESEKLLSEPRTDLPVVASETDAINLLESEIKEMLKSAQGPAQAAMSMMMQAMGMSASAGGNLAGAGTDETNPPLEGDLKGAAADSRSVEKTAGTGTRIVPVEYREALQSYQRALEKMNATLPKANR